MKYCGWNVGQLRATSKPARRGQLTTRELEIANEEMPALRTYDGLSCTSYFFNVPDKMQYAASSLISPSHKIQKAIQTSECI
jgi:hypothetical protein